MDAAPLTDRQREILRFLAGRALAGLPPTVREIGIAFGIGSPNGVRCHLRALAARGLIGVDFARARAVRLVGAVLRLDYEDSEAGRRLREALDGAPPAPPCQEGPGE